MAIPRTACGETDLDFRYIEAVGKTWFSNVIS